MIKIGDDALPKRLHLEKKEWCNFLHDDLSADVTAGGVSHGVYKRLPVTLKQNHYKMSSNKSPPATAIGMKRISLFSKEGRELVSAPSLVGGTSDPESQGGERREPLHEEEEGNHIHTATLYHTKEPACLTCSEVFHSREDQVEHYRLDWHRYNLKRKLKGLEAVDQDSFEKISGDLSSISGSESSSDNEEGVELKPPGHTYSASLRAERRSQYLHFSPVGGISPTHSVFRCIVTGSGSEVTGDSLRQLGEAQVWIILMRSGGHFAGAVFRGSGLVAHKTFHRYTVRAKRGTAQSVRDSQQGGHQPKSAGASLRRYNESALANEMCELMSIWRVYIEEASCIFIRTPKYSKGVLIGDGKGGKAPFVRGDPRLRGIPFPTRRPTLKEVQGVHTKLAAIYVSVARREELPSQDGGGKRHKKDVGVGKGEEPQKEVCPMDKNRTSLNEDQDIPNNDLTTTDFTTEADLDTDDLDTADLNTADLDMNAPTKSKRKKKGKKPAETAPQAVQVPEFIQKLLVECKDADVSTEDHVTVIKEVLEGAGLSCFPIQPPAECDGGSGQTEHLELLNSVWNGDTVLHTAAAHGHSSLIPILMLYGADPAIKNHAGHTPYLVAKNKEVRDSFRRFMAEYPAAYSYERAYIPSPLTQEMEHERSRKEAEKRKEKKKARKKRGKERKEEREVAACEAAQQNTTVSLSERERRAMAAEGRMATQLPPSHTMLGKMGSCSGCGHSLGGMVPFERLDFKYCSMDCLKQHRKHLTRK